MRKVEKVLPINLTRKVAYCFNRSKFPRESELIIDKLEDAIPGCTMDESYAVGDMVSRSPEALGEFCLLPNEEIRRRLTTKL